MVDLLLSRSLAQARSGRNIVVFDLETTGLLKPGQPIPRAWQLAAIDFSFDTKSGALTEVAGYSTILNTGAPLPQVVADICHVDPDLPLLKGFEPVFVLARFGRFLEGKILAGQNILNFDVPILAEEFRRVGLPVPPQLSDPGWCIDTTLMARAIFNGRPDAPRDPATGRPSNKLNVLGAHYGCEFAEADLHDAMADVRLTAQVLGHLLGDVNRQFVSAA